MSSVNYKFVKSEKYCCKYIKSAIELALNHH